MHCWDEEWRPFDPQWSVKSYSKSEADKIYVRHGPRKFKQAVLGNSFDDGICVRSCCVGLQSHTMLPAFFFTWVEVFRQRGSEWAIECSRKRTEQLSISLSSCTVQGLASH